MALSNNSVFATETDEAKLSKSRDRWTAVLLSSSVLGLAAGLGGLALSIVSWFFHDTTKGVSELGTLLVVAFFPLLILAAHSLDKVREAEKALRMEHCRRHGLRDDNSETK